MAKFAIADAANRAGVERTTLYRKLNKGEISAEIDVHGNKVIDAAELLRVYPNARVIDNPATVAPPLPPVEKLQTATGEARRELLREVEIRDEKIEDMKRQIAALEADKTDLRSERDRLLKVIEEQSSSVKLLTEGAKSKDKTGRRFWLLGRRRDLDATDGDGDAGAEFEQLQADGAAGRLRSISAGSIGSSASWNTPPDYTASAALRCSQTPLWRQI